MKNRKIEKALEKITQELLEMDITDLKKELNRQTDSDVFHLLKESGFSSAKELEIEALAEAAFPEKKKIPKFMRGYGGIFQ